jgi:hypothetical protein
MRLSARMGFTAGIRLMSVVLHEPPLSLADFRGAIGMPARFDAESAQRRVAEDHSEDGRNLELECKYDN